MHPFRFGAMAGRATSRGTFLDQVTSIESHGYSTVFITDHFSNKLAPLPALVTAAEVSDLNIGSLVLANDFRHPVVLAKEAATVDLLSDGRLELGVGTGWELSDYQKSGITKPSPGEQVGKLEEAVAILKGLWSDRNFEMAGSHYKVSLNGLPKPTPGRPRLLIGGGARRMLGIAGREADIVGISAAEISGRDDLQEEVPRAGDLLDEKVAWIRTGAGDRFDDLEFNIYIYDIAVTSDRTGRLERIASEWNTTSEAIASSPHFLVGSTDKISEDLEARRERWGISYPVVPDHAIEAMGPVVDTLTGS